MNFFKLYIGDYQRDTAHLSIAEHGAYLLMLQHYYATEKPLPSGKALHRMLRAQDKTERDAIDSVASQFWTETESGLVNSRAAHEIDRADHQRSVNREVGKKGGRPKRTETESVSESVSESEPINNPNQTPDTRHQTPDKGAGIREVDARAPENRSPGAEACIRMKAAGLQAVNPGHPKLLALLAAGITVDELANAAADAVAKGKNFAYAMATAEGRRRDAATPPLPDKAAVTVPSRSDRDPVLVQKDAEAAAWRPPTADVKAMLAQTAARLKGVTT